MSQKSIISLQEALKKIEILEKENSSLKHSLKKFKNYAYKTGEIYRIHFKNTNYAYIGKTVQNTKTRFLQHTRDHFYCGFFGRVFDRIIN